MPALVSFDDVSLFFPISTSSEVINATNEISSTKSSVQGFSSNLTAAKNDLDRAASSSTEEFCNVDGANFSEEFKKQKADIDLFQQDNISRILREIGAIVMQQQRKEELVLAAYNLAIEAQKAYVNYQNAKKAAEAIPVGVEGTTNNLRRAEADANANSAQKAYLSAKQEALDAHLKAMDTEPTDGYQWSF